MKRIVIDESSEEGRELLKAIHALQQSGNPAIISIRDCEVENSLAEPLAHYQFPTAETREDEDECKENTSFSRIPGLASGGPPSPV